MDTRESAIYVWRTEDTTVCGDASALAHAYEHSRYSDLEPPHHVMAWSHHAKTWTPVQVRIDLVHTSPNAWMDYQVTLTCRRGDEESTEVTGFTRDGYA